MGPDNWLNAYGDLLFNFAVVRVRNHDVAEDLVQETLVAAYRSRERFEGRSREGTWLVSILKHKMMNYFRRASRERPFTDLHFLEDEKRDQFDDQLHWRIKDHMGPIDWGEKPVQALANQEFWRVFHTCMGRLPERIAQVFIMREADGLSSEEICEVVDISKSNLWVMLHRARLALRECLEENWIKAGRDRNP